MRGEEIKMETKCKVEKEDGGYTKFTLENQYGTTEIKVRNVSKKNPESALQFNVTEYPRFKKRSKFTCFSLPKGAISSFIEALKEEEEK